MDADDRNMLRLTVGAIAILAVQAIGHALI